jgi:putative ABC transport system substrate-binding protein
MKRREFIAALAGTVAAWPLAARAQQPRMPVVGFIGANDQQPRPLVAFRKGLNESGYVEGRNVAIEYRWVEGHNERLPAILAELSQRPVDVIAAVDSTAAALAAKATTQTIPIVFRIGGDPIAAGLVSSLSRPDGNLTGATTLGNQFGPKQLEILRELLPAGVNVAVLINPTNASAARQVEELKAAAQLLDVHLLMFHASSPSDLATAFGNFSGQAIRGLLIVAEPLFFLQRDRLVALVAGQAIPAIYSDPIFVEAGGLMSYGTNSSDGYRIAGVYTGRILKGERAADLPVQQSAKVELAINVKTAKALGLAIPLPLLGRADEVIE